MVLEVAFFQLKRSFSKRHLRKGEALVVVSSLGFETDDPGSISAGVRFFLFEISEVLGLRAETTLLFFVRKTLC